MNIIITDSNFADDLPEREVLAGAGLGLTRFACRTEEDLIEAGNDADAALVQFAPVTRRVLESWKACRLIVRYGIGYDNVDVKAASELGIAVCNVPSYCLDEVADHTCAMLLSGLRKLLPFHQSVMSGEWNVERIARPMPRFAETAIGFVGFGRIGAKVAERLRPYRFQMKTYDPYLSEEKALEAGVGKSESLDALLTECDAVSLHAPLTEETRHLINRRTLEFMKPNAFLVNTSRGGLVDTEALAEALEQGRLGLAALDVYEEEPLRPEHPLRRCGHVLLTPHAAYYSDAALSTLQRQAAEEVSRWAKGLPLESQVNARR